MTQPTAPGGDLGEILESGQQVSQPAGLDWLEKMAPQVKKQPQKPDDDEQKQKQQLERLKEIDKKRSREMYEAIQQEIEMIRKKRDSQPRKYISGTTGFEADPEVRQKKFLEQQKKKDDDLSAATKASMGTGEANRGAVG
ncbi:MAG: hypothetical protein AAB430_00470 [Patescibacteria group bacterium]